MLNLLSGGHRWVPEASFILSSADLFMSTPRSEDRFSIYYSWFRYPKLQHLHCFSKMCTFERQGECFSLLSCSCIHAFDAGIFWREGKHAFLSSPPLTLPSSIPHSLQLLTSRNACVNAPCFDWELFFLVGIIMGLLGLVKYPAFLAFIDFFWWISLFSLLTLNTGKRHEIHNWLQQKGRVISSI